jgi:hypothetical protein
MTGVICSGESYINTGRSSSPTPLSPARRGSTVRRHPELPRFRRTVGVVVTNSIAWIGVALTMMIMAWIWPRTFVGWTLICTSASSGARGWHRTRRCRTKHDRFAGGEL